MTSNLWIWPLYFIYFSIFRSLRTDSVLVIVCTNCCFIVCTNCWRRCQVSSIKSQQVLSTNCWRRCNKSQQVSSTNFWRRCLNFWLDRGNFLLYVLTVGTDVKYQVSSLNKFQVLTVGTDV